MKHPGLNVPKDKQHVAVVTWRVIELERMGFDYARSTYIGAYMLEVDIHDLERLIKQGCDPETALEIVR